MIESVWRDQPGKYFCVSTREKSGRWRDHFFGRRELAEIKTFVHSQRDKNVYFCPHGFLAPGRRKQHAVLGSLLWADLDNADPRVINPKPTIAIQSSPGRYVGLWECDDKVTEDLNRRLTYFVGADKSGWDVTQVLRMPGTRNFKYTPPPKVEVMWDDGPEHSVAKLDRLLPQLHTTRVALPISEFEIDWSAVAALDFRDVFQKYPGTHMRKYLGWCRIGKRSSVIYAIAASFIERGASVEEVACVLLRSGAYQSKFEGEDRAGHRHIGYTCSKLLAAREAA